MRCQDPGRGPHLDQPEWFMSVLSVLLPGAGMIVSFGPGSVFPACSSVSAARWPAWPPPRRPRFSLPEQNVQGLRPVARGGNGPDALGRLPGLLGVMGQHPADHVLLAGSEVELSGRDLGMSENRLHIGQGKGRVLSHPVNRGMINARSFEVDWRQRQQENSSLSSVNQI